MCACPQKQNGYVPIANEIYDALIGIRIPGEAEQCLKLIIRKTYGYNKKEDAISLSQFCSFTGLKKPNVCKAIRKLKEIIGKDHKLSEPEAEKLKKLVEPNIPDN
jgi:phage replication O-like protein O